MFLRKSLVMVIPLVFYLLSILFYPLLADRVDPFFLYLILGTGVGIMLAFFVPLMGGRRKEPFARLFLIPAILFIILILLQTLQILGLVQAHNLRIFHFSNWFEVFIESLFMGYLMVLALRG